MSASEPEAVHTEDGAKVEITHKVTVEKVKLPTLQIDHTYQRTINAEFVDELAREWDPIKAEMILVSWRGMRKDDDAVEGGRFIVSGQHRARAAARRGDKEIEARVIDLSKEEDPAAIEAYYRLGTNRRNNDRTIDAFRARLAMHDEVAVGIVEILKSFDTRINWMQNQTDDSINAVSALETLYRVDGGALLRDTLKVIQRTWGKINSSTASGDVLKAVGWFIRQHDIECDPARLVSNLQTVTVSQLKARASAMQAIQGKSKWMNMYTVIVELYNDKMKDRNRLQLNYKMGSQTQGAGASRPRRGGHRSHWHEAN